MLNAPEWALPKRSRRVRSVGVSVVIDILHRIAATSVVVVVALIHRIVVAAIAF